MQRRPWQLLITGNTKEPIAFSVETRDALTSMFELFPHLSGLTLKTRHGDLSVTRDFPGDYTSRVDEMIAAVFRNNPDITGIVFPATSTRPNTRPHLTIRIGRQMAGYSQRSVQP